MISRYYNSNPRIFFIKKGNFIFSVVLDTCPGILFFCTLFSIVMLSENIILRKKYITYLLLGN